MAGPFASQEQKMRENASNWLALAKDVWAYRRDVMSDAEVAEFQSSCAELQKSLRDDDDPARMKLKIEAVESVLGRVGGTLYPKTGLTENVSFFLVAALVVLSLRAYFIQPFKIPTNSMWPTYSGLVAAPLPLTGPPPGFLEQTILGASGGATYKEMLAPASGNIQIPLFERNGRIAFTEKTVRTWLFFPSRVREYTFYVNGKPTTISVSADYEDFDFVAMETLFTGLPDVGVGEQESWILRHTPPSQVEHTFQKMSEEAHDTERVALVTLPTTVAKGAPILRFELLSGDQLVVDRFSYNFVRPQVGDAIVFQTGHIPDVGVDDFYIKRLAGLPGDTIEVHPPRLFRNGSPIQGSTIFELNASEHSPYRGYTSISKRYGGKETFLYDGGKVVVPPLSLFAMGDNSHFSADSRYWGFVPEKDVIGRPLFIYYPFTTRWGIAR